MCYRVDGFSLQEDIQTCLLIVYVEKEFVAEFSRQGIRKWPNCVLVVAHMVAFELHNARLIVGILVGVDRNRQEGLYPDFFSYSADKLGKLYHSITQSWPKNFIYHGCILFTLVKSITGEVSMLESTSITNLKPTAKYF